MLVSKLVYKIYLISKDNSIEELIKESFTLASLVIQTQGEIVMNPMNIEPIVEAGS